MHHFRKTSRKYHAHNNSDKTRGGCTLCPERNVDKIIHDGTTMYVIKNRVQYDMFEGRRVADHLMVIPKCDREMVSEFSNEESMEMVNIIGDYEKQGYNFYGRGLNSLTRSVKHQHTHLIKLVPYKQRFILMIRKPY